MPKHTGRRGGRGGEKNDEKRGFQEKTSKNPVNPNGGEERRTLVAHGARQVSFVPSNLLGKRRERTGEGSWKKKVSCGME